MGIIKKTVFAQNLDRYNAFLTDTDTNSRYFRVTQIPDVFTGGKNAFLIQGSTELANGSYLMIEIKDSSGNTIYYEPAFGKPDYYEGTSKPVAVYIYSDTAFGPCTITILGELTQYEIGGIKYPIPDNWIGVPNVKWQRRVNVNPNLKNTTPIRFYKRPTATVTEQLLPIYNRTVNNNVSYGYLTGTSVLPVDRSTSPFFGETVYLITSVASGSFPPTPINELPIGTTLNISNIRGLGLSSTDESVIDFVPSTLNTKILSYIDTFRAYVDIPYLQSFKNKQYYRDILIAGWTASFESGTTFVPSGFSSSFANIKIENLDTFSGDVARCKVFIKSKNSVRGYELLEDVVLDSSELLRTPSFENNINVRTGLFTSQNILTTFWDKIDIDGVGNVVTGSYPVADSVDLQPVSNDTGNPFIFKFQADGGFLFKEGKEYQLSFTPTLVAVEGTTNTIGKLEIYATSSLGANTDGTFTFYDSGRWKERTTYKPGKFLADYSADSSRRFSKQYVNFLADTTGTGTISFNVLQGMWNLYDISLKAYQEDSFTPTDISFLTKPVQLVVSESFDFKFEFFDTNFNFVPVKVENQLQFLGGSDIVPSLTISASAISFSVGQDGISATPATISIDYTINAINNPNISFTTGSGFLGAYSYDNKIGETQGVLAPKIERRIDPNVPENIKPGYPYPGLLADFSGTPPVGVTGRRLLYFSNFSSSLRDMTSSDYLSPDNERRTQEVEYYIATSGGTTISGNAAEPLTARFSIVANYDNITTTTTTTTTTTSTTSTSTTSTTTTQPANTKFTILNNWSVKVLNPNPPFGTILLADPQVAKIEYKVSSGGTYAELPSLQWSAGGTPISINPPYKSRGFYSSVTGNDLYYGTGSLLTNIYDFKITLHWSGSTTVQHPFDAGDALIYIADTDAQMRIADTFVLSGTNSRTGSYVWNNVPVTSSVSVWEFQFGNELSII